MAAVSGLTAGGVRHLAQRVELGFAAVAGHFGDDCVDDAGGAHTEPQRLAGDRLDRPALLGVGGVGVAGAGRAVADHESASFRSAARRSSMAWLHSSGVATGPHRSSHSCRKLGSSRWPSTCSGR